MVESKLTELGVGGIFAILVIQMVLSFLTRRNNCSPTKVLDRLVKLIEKQTEVLMGMRYEQKAMHEDVKRAHGE